ncbi:hypothetical protein L218DRAFT_945931 [Marasmius fiardii PR-910]|nr:hypothetical protein L218DRAFT_945931 [Marasmius fiardii PR-910]
MCNRFAHDSPPSRTTAVDAITKSFALWSVLTACVSVVVAYYKFFQPQQTLTAIRRETIESRERKKESSVMIPLSYIDIGTRRFLLYLLESRSNPEADGQAEVLELNHDWAVCKAWSTSKGQILIRGTRGIQAIGSLFRVHLNCVSEDRTEETALDLTSFVKGRFLPVVASTLYDHDSKLVVLGNEYTDIYTMIPPYHDMTCTIASILPILDIRHLTVSTVGRGSVIAEKRLERLLRVQLRFLPSSESYNISGKTCGSGMDVLKMTKSETDKYSVENDFMERPAENTD